MRDQPLDCLRQIGHRRRGVATTRAAATLLEGGTQPVDRALQIGAAGPDAVT